MPPRRTKTIGLGYMQLMAERTAASRSASGYASDSGTTTTSSSPPALGMLQPTPTSATLFIHAEASLPVQTGEPPPVPMLNLCVTITELSSNDHEVVESNNILTSPWVGGYFFQESIGTTEDNNGAMVVYQGGNEPHSTGVNDLLRHSTIGNANQRACEELDGKCQERNLEGLQFLEHTLGCVEFDVPSEESHSNDGVGEDNVDQSNAMGSAHGSLEQLLAEEFDPAEPFLWGNPEEHDHGEGIDYYLIM
ncbi:unnamed protein product [Cochlearia groenlandica]